MDNRTLFQFLTEESDITAPDEFAVEARVELPTTTTIQLTPEDPNTQIEVPGMGIFPLSMLVQRIDALSQGSEKDGPGLSQRLQELMQGDPEALGFIELINEKIQTYTKALIKHYQSKNKEPKNEEVPPNILPPTM